MFSGDGQKHDTSYAQWRSEVHSVWRSGLYQEAMVVTSIKRSLRGRAADVLLAMGADVSVEQVLAKFDVRFGDVQPNDKALEHFFSARHLNPFLYGDVDWKTCLVMWLILVVLPQRGRCWGQDIGVVYTQTK